MAGVRVGSLATIAGSGLATGGPVVTVALGEPPPLVSTVQPATKTAADSNQAHLIDPGI